MSNALIKKSKKKIIDWHPRTAIIWSTFHLIINILLIQLATPWETNCNDDNFYSHKPPVHSLSRGLFMRCRIWECNEDGEDIFSAHGGFIILHINVILHIKQVGSS